MSKYVAFFDILGFKKLIENNSSEYLIGEYEASFTEAYNIADEHIKETMKSDDVEVKIKSSFISDSLIFWTENTGSDEFISLVIFFNALMVSFFMKGLPLRGAIVSGELLEVSFPKLSNQNLNGTPVLLGKGLVEAYNKENLQNWTGCVVSQTAIDNFLHHTSLLSGRVTLEQLMQLRFLLKYKVPMKKESAELSYVLNWPFYLPKYVQTKEFIAKAFESHNKSCDSDTVKEKIDNTYNFFKFSSNQRNLDINL